MSPTGELWITLAYGGSASNSIYRVRSLADAFAEPSGHVQVAPDLVLALGYLSRRPAWCGARCVGAGRAGGRGVSAAVSCRIRIVGFGYDDAAVQCAAEYGEVFTRRWVVDLILDLCGYMTAVDLTSLVLVDPSVGSGAFVEPVVERLLQARAASGTPWADLSGCVCGWDVQPHHVETCRKVAREQLVAPAARPKRRTSWLRDGFGSGISCLMCRPVLCRCGGRQSALHPY